MQALSDGIVLIVFDGRLGYLNVLLTSVINSKKYLTPKEEVNFFLQI